jgi:hypothetical protein
MKVSVPTQDTINTISVKTPITSSGKPMDTAMPTCLIGPKPAELLLRLCLSLTGVSLVAGSERPGDGIARPAEIARGAA